MREVETGFRYTPTSCFETFPFPEPDEAQRTAIAEAAAKLATIRAGGVGMIDEANPKGRTLPELYAQMPSWLRFAHDRLDEAVAAAYVWSVDLSDDEIVSPMLDLSFDRLPA